MKAYLAAQYSRRREVLGYKATLEAMGVYVTANWLNGHHEKPDGDVYLDDDLREMAVEDWEDLQRSDTVISFTEPKGSIGLMRGGRHVECGAGLALGKRSIVIGHRENIFHHLPYPYVEFYPSWQAFLVNLGLELSVGVGNGA